MPMLIAFAANTGVTLLSAACALALPIYMDVISHILG